MLQKSVKKQTVYDPYDCALQLATILKRKGVGPVVAIVTYDFLKAIIDGNVTCNDSMYEYLGNLYIEKLSLFNLGQMSEAELQSQSKCFMLLTLEILDHAKLLNGLSLKMQPVCEIAETTVQIKLKLATFGPTQKGIAFVKKMDDLKEKSMDIENYARPILQYLNEEVNFIIERYKNYKTKDNKNDDVIVISSIQA